MAAQMLRSEFLCILNGFVGSPRDIGTTPRGVTIPQLAALLKVLACVERCCPTEATGC
jgi:hypothetical protein